MASQPVIGIRFEIETSSEPLLTFCRSIAGGAGLRHWRDNKKTWKLGNLNHAICEIASQIQFERNITKLN